MDVKEILALMAQTSIGIDNPTSMTQDLYLNYLNLYHFELYNKTFKINPFIAKDRIHWIDITNNIVIGEGDESLKANSILQLNKIHWIKTFDNKDVGDTLPYKIQDNVIIIDKPIGFFKEEDNWISIDYIPNPVNLEQTTVKEDIPYPVAFQQVLVYGASYHMYQNEGGMRSTSQMQFNMVKCKEFENNLMTYLYDLTKKPQVPELQEYRGM